MLPIISNILQFSYLFYSLQDHGDLPCTFYIFQDHRKYKFYEKFKFYRFPSYFVGMINSPPLTLHQDSAHLEQY